MAVDGDRKNTLGRFLADDVLVELSQNFARRGNAGKKLLARAASFTFLVEDTLAKLDALAADVNVARSFDQRSDVPVTFATERTERILLGCAAAACSAADVPARWHSKLLPGRRRSYAMAREKRMIAFGMSYGVSRSIVNLRSRPSPTSIRSHSSHVRSGGASLSPVVTRAALETDAAHFLYPVITTSRWRSSFAKSEGRFLAPLSTRRTTGPAC